MIGMLLFRLGNRRYALPSSAISGLADAGPVRTVPGAGSAVLGLTEWRGSLLTVVDVAALLGGRPAGDAPASMLRLAPPLEHTALYLPASVQLGSGEISPAPGSDEDPAGVVAGLHEGSLLYVIDPARLVSQAGG